ncbi:dTDP-glucose 4,6-dehydratase [Pseudaminobacter salicylatoxidans]|uniref:dTDP-glucose 4,6-dehydratase n=1 Tax=Pseudaminobacter salicylatoxidans TaxID=93369 RepID=A0A316CS15_PSESE|nr:dTDP-glucose 4,6-dehydratase [Pseudaminobacter salicylatoxidans]
MGRHEGESKTVSGAEIIVVTGGLGFIGKHFVRRCLEDGRFVKNIDCISYAADRSVNAEFSKFKNYRFYESDICNLDFLPECDIFVNFAAESHVDNAITNAKRFCETNFLGVQRCLELVRLKHERERPLFIQISTDEVYGDIRDGSHTETDTLVPSNPYAATKAAADMLVQSWGRTYSVSWNIVRPTNNYGVHQYPEKLIPKSAWRMKRGMPAIMHGDGSYIRSWLHVDDTINGILTVIEKGSRNQIYNIGSTEERRNIDVLRRIAGVLGISENAAFVSVADRSGQDVRYSLDDSRLRGLGWSPRRKFDDEIIGIVEQLDNSRFI